MKIFLSYLYEGDALRGAVRCQNVFCSDKAVCLLGSYCELRLTVNICCYGFKKFVKSLDFKRTDGYRGLQ